jgi:hypothetical protein
MSDTQRQFRTLRNHLNRLYPSEPEGNLARHLNTLAALLSGLVSSRRANLPAIAAKVPDGALPESRVKRFSRWVRNERIDLETYFLPYAERLLESLAHRPLLLVMDGSAIGRGCATLTINVVYRKRALPLAWIVLKGSKGHFAEACHLALLEQIVPLIPPHAEVVFLGDGEFDGTQLQETIDHIYQWKYVCRTAKSITLKDGEIAFTPGGVALYPGECVSFPRVLFTRDEYGPVHVIAWWEPGYEDPIYLVTNLKNAHQACIYYRKRFRIETFFSDQKSRGFHLNKSHLTDPDRLRRLMMPACLAYIWIVYLGLMATEDGWIPIIHRTDRCDLSLFQLGLRLLDHFLNEGDGIPVAFTICELGPV